MTERNSLPWLATARGAGRAVREHGGRLAPGWAAVILRVAGSGLLIATAAMHLDLYLTGYRSIPTIGWLFLLQVIAAFGLGLAVLAIPVGGLPECQPAGWRPRREPAWPWLPSAATSCRSGSGCSGSRRSTRRRPRRWPGGGGRLRGPGRARACSRPVLWQLRRVLAPGDRHRRGQ